MQRSIRRAVIPVAGLGARMLPATKVVPKEMLAIVDKPVIQYGVEEAWEAGIEEIIFVVSSMNPSLRKHFSPSHKLETHLRDTGKQDDLQAILDTVPEQGKFSFVLQEEPLGLGHAIWCAREKIGNEAFAVILPDDVIAANPSCLSQLITTYNAQGGNVLALMQVAEEDVASYGIATIAERNGPLCSVSGLVEKPNPGSVPSSLAIIGRYILQPEIMGFLEGMKPGAGNEIQLTDAIEKSVEDTKLWGLLFDGERFDCGSKLGYLTANLAFGLAHASLGEKFHGIATDLLLRRTKK